jgi:hypothetical protein
MMAMTRSAEKGCYETLILACDMFQLLTWAGPLLNEQLLTEQLLNEQLLTEQLLLFSLSFLAFQMSEPQVSKNVSAANLCSRRIPQPILEHNKN